MNKTFDDTISDIKQNGIVVYGKLNIKQACIIGNLVCTSRLEIESEDVEDMILDGGNYFGVDLDG
jgi:hypothetical protein